MHLHDGSTLQQRVFTQKMIVESIFSLQCFPTKGGVAFVLTEVNIGLVCSIMWLT